MRLFEAASVALESCRAHRGSLALATIGIVVGSATLVLVVSIGLTGKQYVATLVQGIGANMIVAEYYGGGGGDVNSGQDYLTVDDLGAVMKQIPDIVAGSPVLELHDRLTLAGGRTQQVLELGVFPDYRAIRNLVVVSGRFMDQEDSTEHTKVAVVTVQLAQSLCGGSEAALGRPLSIQGVPFTIVGTFRERVETFGQSEITAQTILLPYAVARTISTSDGVQQLFFSTRHYAEIDRVSQQIASMLQLRHRPGSKYVVTNLTSLVQTAGDISLGVLAVMLAVSLATLIVGGVGIMNIMLATVGSRTHEIGIRKAMGATASDIHWQFLIEALVISLGGGILGVAFILAIAVTIHFLTGIGVLLSVWSIVAALLACISIAVIFGVTPARRAARLNPVDALKHE
jgi:putative ABC transport system permease protein